MLFPAPIGDQGFKDLKTALLTAALSNGAKMVCRGVSQSAEAAAPPLPDIQPTIRSNRKKRSLNKHPALPSRCGFACQRSRVCRPEKRAGKRSKQAATLPRKFTASNDRKNNRENGKALPRKTGASMAVTAGFHTCPFKFGVTKDPRRHCFCCGVGSSCHKCHVERIKNGVASMPARRHLPPVETPIILSIANANIMSDGVAQNLCCERTKVLLPRSKIWALHLMSKRDVTNDESLEHEDLMAQFEKNKISFCLLFHHHEIDENGEGMLLVLFALVPGKIWNSAALRLVSHELAKAGADLVELTPLIHWEPALCTAWQTKGQSWPILCGTQPSDRKIFKRWLSMGTPCLMS
jgi:hypothetical protein